MSGLYQRGNYILRHEGPAPLLRQLGSFLAGFLYRRGDYYIFEKTLDGARPVGAQTDEPGFTLNVICSVGDLDSLLAGGYDLRNMAFRPKLESGARAFCMFAGLQLAHVTWVASSPEAKKRIDRLPFSVDFQGGEVCSGDSFTAPEYRGRGLLGRTYDSIFRCLLDENVERDRFTIAVANESSRKAHARFGPVIVGRGRYLRILWWQLWKEIPFKEAG